MSRKKLYFFIPFFTLIGLSWIILNYFTLGTRKPVVNICLFRTVTGIPCPSCGTTHAVISIIKGDLKKALHENILGFPVTLMILLFPTWIIIDIIRKKVSFYQFYLRSEFFLRNKWIAWSAMALLLANWGWHIFFN